MIIERLELVDKCKKNLVCQSFKPSGPRNPCPVCGRTKDGDCRTTNEGLALCHTCRDCRPGEIIRGQDGQEWACVGNTDRGAGWGIFKPHEPSRRWQKPVRPAGVTYYDYPGRDGRPLVRVKRTDNGDGTKTFSQERWDGSRWVPGLGNLDRRLIPIYRYREVREAIARGELIFFTEGESAADALWSIGIPATTSIGGSGGFNRYGSYHQDLEGARLVICPDRDPKGLAYGDEVARAFNGAVVGWIYAGEKSAWENPNDGYDLADWIADLRVQGLADADIKARILGAIEPRRELPVATSSNGNGSRQLVGDGFGDDQAKPERKSVAILLLEIARGEAQFWQSDGGETWADFWVDGVMQWHPIRSRAFRAWLGRRLFELHGKAPNNEAMQSCLNILEAYSYGTPRRRVFLRTAYHEGKYYLDLTNDRWQVVEIGPDGWRVIDSRDCPVRFARHEGQLPLPVPVPGGDISRLWELIPISRESDRILLLAWVVFALTPGGSKPVLALYGARGAGKSWTAETLSQLVDPVKAPLLRVIADARNFATAASKRWLLCFDNLSHLSPQEQDLLCCASTGAGFSHRRLFSDLDEVFCEYTRPQVLTSVEFIPSRSDLLDRCLVLGVDRIPEDQRQPLEHLAALRDAYRPALLGCLLDRVAAGLKHKESIRTPLPRMADFARFSLAVEKAHPWGSLDFASVYQENIAGALERTIEADPVAAALLELMQDRTHWEGPAGELLAKLQSLSDDPKVQKLSTRSLGRWLASAATRTDLRTLGIEIDSYRRPGGNRERGWLLTRTEKADKVRDINVPHVPNVPNPEKHGASAGTLMGHYSGHQPEKRPTNNVLNVPPENSRVNGHSGDANTPKRDIRDVRDMKSGDLFWSDLRSTPPPVDRPAPKPAGTPLKPPGGKFRPGDYVEYYGDDPGILQWFPDRRGMVVRSTDTFVMVSPSHDPNLKMPVMPDDWGVIDGG